MITFTSGNVLAANAQALVNTVNTDGVMGKGIALHFKEQFPENYRSYRAACLKGDVVIGKMHVFENLALTGPRWIINFPTKTSWRQRSQLAYITAGLKDLVHVVARCGITSIAVPPLGCGNGGLNWRDVRPLIQAAFAELTDVHAQIYEPAASLGSLPGNGTDTLTPARATILAAIRHYLQLDGDCTPIEVQKLSYFIERVCAGLRLESPLQLRFQPNLYGPYCDALRHVLVKLDGSFLHCHTRMADAGAADLLWLDDARDDRLNAYLGRVEMRPMQAVLNMCGKIWAGFETPFDIELLATVDWLQNQSKQVLSVPELMQGIKNWPHANGAERKFRLFDERVVGIARGRLAEFGQLLYG